MEALASGSIITVLIVSNVGAAMTLIFAAGKVVWFISKLSTRVEHMEQRIIKHEKEHDKIWGYINPSKQKL